MKLTDLFVPFKAVQASRKKEAVVPDLQTNWIDFMQSRNNQVLPQASDLPVQPGYSDESEEVAEPIIVERPLYPVISPTQSNGSGASSGNLVRSVLQRNPEAYADYRESYDQYVREHPEDNDLDMRAILSNIAAHESGYRHNVLNPTGSASGWYQFIDSTRLAYSNLNRELFKNDKQAQISAAVKMYKKLYNTYYTSPKWRELIRQRGLSVAQVIYGGWFRPASLQYYLEHGRFDNFSDALGTTLLKVWDSYN